MIDETELNDAFKNIIDSITKDLDNPVINSTSNLTLDDHILFADNTIITENNSIRIFGSHEEAKQAASILARQMPGHKISILRTIENVGFTPFN